MKQKASFYKKLDENKVRCNLCSHNCIIKTGDMGICNVRKNIDGELYSMIYGSASSVAADPIEKKPLFHFHPGTKAFSLGTVGCNFKCRYCQNSEISTAGSDFSYIRQIEPEDVIDMCNNYNCQGIAWTYNEPTIWHEFAYDTSKLAKKHDFYTCYVTNGYISEEALREISSVLDAMNIDVKAFTDDFYKNICKARLNPVLDTCILAKDLGIHIELTYLVIPSMNDSRGEIDGFLRWIVDNLGNDVPLHFSRFHPDYMMKNIQSTPLKTLKRIYKDAKNKGVKHVYLGNILSSDYENTFCPKCGNICIKRSGFDTEIIGMKDGKCINCGEKLNILR